MALRLAALLLGTLGIVAWIIFDVGEWLASRSDSVWWAMLPWILLIVLWVFLVVFYLRKRTRGTE